ncbi:MAG: 3-keto-5-aminohexanoate cleavage protein [Gammaproteobacteria bacterium]|nr:3-keto-5-aminohexanoate cleavage protein [Gammaproteobacteria bacterium]
MFTSIATVSISGTLESKLRAIARAGFNGVEIFENDLLTSQVSARDAGALMRDLGLECTLFQPFRDFEGMPDTLRPRIFERIERKFDVMQELGTDLLLVCSNVSPAASADRGRIVADFRELGERAAKRGLRVGYEALAWGRHVSDHRKAWSIVLDVDHPAIGLILDSFQSLARNIPNESLREIDPARIFIVQLADAPVLQMDFLSWSRHFRNMPGQGELPLVDYVATLLEQGYTGALSLEIFNDRFRSSSATAVALDGHRALNFLSDQVARRLAPRIAPELPPRARVRGVEFVEFAANEGEVEQLESLFTTLGFSRSGKHRTKDVMRWRQNGINFVINNEPDSFARAYDGMHGASVCALGVSVENVANALRRAEGLQIEQFSQPLGPGELVIPCVHGVGGSLLYFTEAGSESAVWDTEFVAVQGSPVNGNAGLLRVDHVAQTMQHEEMLSWLLYYVSLFDVSKTPVVQVADPLGLVQSQAIESAEGGLRITLNASTSSQTLSARFLQGYHGAGVQHIALATADIFASARRLRELGLATLPIPRNYYEDLEARFGLGETLLAQLAEFNILYDRDTDGEYFHLVSRAFAKRFFFEVIERRGYRAYGAANATIRLAAQSRYRDDLDR